jgi:hypothetical protein
MKRIIPLLILAFVIAACQEDGPTVPTDGPQFATAESTYPPRWVKRKSPARLAISRSH